MRLTNHVKYCIVEVACKKAGLVDAVDALVKDRADWAERARVMSLGIPEEELVAKLQAAQAIVDTIPYTSINSNLRPFKNNYVWINIGGCANTVPFNGEFKWTTGNTPSPYRICNSKGITFTATNPMAIEWEALVRREDALIAKRDSIRHDVMATLNTVKTVKQLLGIWPEAIELVPDATPKAMQTALAIPVETLNKSIGLPSK